MADGSITIDTSIDTSGVSDADKVIAKSLNRIGKKLKEAFGMDFANKAEKNIQRMQERYEAATGACERQKENVMELKKQLADLESQRMGEKNYMEPEAAKPLIKQAEQLKTALDEAKQKVREYTEKAAQGSVVAADKQEEWQQKVSELKKEYNNVLDKIEQIENKSDAGIQTKITALNGKLKSSEQRFDSLNQKMQSAKKNLEQAVNAKKVAPLNEAMSKASKSVKRFGRRITELVKSALIFSVITKAVTALRELFGSMLKSNNEFADSWAKIKGNLLTAFQPIYEAALPALMSLMHVLERVSAALASFSAQIFGKSVSKMQANAKALYEQANATNAAGKAAENAKKSLAGFDEINQLSDNQGSESNSSSNTVAPDFGSEAVDTSKLDKIVSYGSLLAGIGFLMVGIGTGNIGAILAGVALVALGITIGESSGAFEDTPGWVRQALTWGSMVVGVVMIIVGFTGNIHLLIAGLAMLGVGVAYGAKSGAFKEVANAIKNLCDSVTLKFKEWGASVKEWFNTHIKPVFTKEYWREKFEKIKQSIVDFKNSAVQKFTEIWTGIRNTFANVGSWFGQKFRNAWTSIKNAFSSVGTFFGNIWTGIRNTFANVGSWFGQKFRDAWTSIRNAFSSTGAFFGNIWTTIKTKFTDIGTKVGDAIGGAFKKAINAVLATVEKVINTPINAINGLLGIINKVPGINIGTLNTVTLPRLATGTVVPANFGEFAAILGDNRREPEVVSPLSTMKQAFVEALKEGGKSNGQPMIIQMFIDKKMIGEAACEYHNGVVVRTGVSPLKGVG